MKIKIVKINVKNHLLDKMNILKIVWINVLLKLKKDQ